MIFFKSLNMFIIVALKSLLTPTSGSPQVQFLFSPLCLVYGFLFLWIAHIFPTYIVATLDTDPWSQQTCYCSLYLFTALVELVQWDLCPLKCATADISWEGTILIIWGWSGLAKLSLTSSIHIIVSCSFQSLLADCYIVFDKPWVVDCSTFWFN